MRYQLIVAVKEQEYVRRLAEYVRDSPFGELWQLTAFTNPEAFLHFLKGGYHADLIAAQPSMLDAAGAAIANVPIVALVAGRGQYPQYKELLQFQPLPELLQSIVSLNALSGSTIHSAGEEDMRIITVCSASGGVGKTALSLQLVNTAANNGFRVFYLNLERWNTMAAWLGKEAMTGSSEGFSQLLYLVKTQPDKVGGWLIEHRQRHSALKGDYVLPCSNVDDRLTLGAIDASAVVQAIAATGQYDYLVIDLADGLSELELGLFERSNQVVWLMTDDKAVQQKLKLIHEYGERIWDDRFRAASRRFRYVINRHRNDASAVRMDRIISDYLPFVDGVQQSGLSAILASPLYKAAVERLFQHLVKEGGGKQLVNR